MPLCGKQNSTINHESFDSGLSHFFSHKINISGRISKHIENGANLFRKERRFLGVV